MWAVHPLLSAILALLVVVPAFRLGWLSVSGGISALVVGSVTLTAGGWAAAVVLLTFFMTSSILSRWRAERKKRMELLTARGTRRGAVQVLANGGVATLSIALYLLTGEDRWWLAFAGAYAAANADTWSSEIGALSPVPPHHLLTGHPLEAGDSGGVTLQGFLAGWAGSLLVAITAGVLLPLPLSRIASVAIGGFMGTLVDSLLGATVQARYRCVRCGERVESAQHCASLAQYAGGWRWMSNDMVNLLCTLTGAAVAFLLGNLI